MSTQHDRAVRLTLRWTLFSLLAFGGFYVFALFFFVSNWDVFETCTYFRDETYDSLTAETSAIFPLKNTCNADYDMVPAFMNPTIVVLGVVVLLSSASLIGAFTHRTEFRARS